MADRGRQRQFAKFIILKVAVSKLGRRFRCSEYLMKLRHEPRYERSFRLVVSLALLGVGAILLSKGYDAAYVGKEDERPDGNSEQWAYSMLGCFAWIVGVYWSRVRIVSWAFTLFFAWWCYSTAVIF